LIVASRNGRTECVNSPRPNQKQRSERCLGLIRNLPLRRLLPELAGTAPIAALPAAADADALAHPDRELLGLCAEFERLEAEYGAAYPADPPSINAQEIALAEQARIGDVQSKLVDRMHKLRTTTLEGHAARARSLIRTAPDLIKTQGDAETMLLSAILRDLMGLPRLKQWAFGSGEEGGIYRWPENRQGRYAQANDSWGRCVPVDVLEREVGGKRAKVRQMSLFG
jgi:hypothetical protein